MNDSQQRCEESVRLKGTASDGIGITDQYRTNHAPHDSNIHVIHRIHLPPAFWKTSSRIRLWTSFRNPGCSVSDDFLEELLWLVRLDVPLLLRTDDMIYTRERALD